MRPFPLLTFSVVSGNTDLPQNLARRIRCLYHAPHGEKFGLLCFSQQIARGVSSGWFRYWRKQRPDVRETQAALLGPGSVVFAFFCSQIPKSSRCSMIRFLLSSRWTRFQYRFLFQLSNLAGHTAATVALGALLLLPALYFGEVL